MPSLGPCASIASADCAIAIRHLRARGEKIPNELMPYLAPLGWQHINLTGDYIWTEPSRLHGEGFRPLAVPSSSTHTDVLDLPA